MSVIGQIPTEGEKLELFSMLLGGDCKDDRYIKLICYRFQSLFFSFLFLKKIDVITESNLESLLFSRREKKCKIVCFRWLRK